MQRRHFTLIELMAAMVVLVIMMGFLFKFIVSSQNLWTASERNSRIYENAQIFFELLARDLTSAVASNQPGQEVAFWVGPNSGDDGDKDFLAFATMSPSGPHGKTKIWEVHYKWGKPTATGEYLIRRSVVADTDSGGAPDADWDFYGKAGQTDVSAWVVTDNLAEVQEVIDGVEEIEIACYLTGSSAPVNPGSTGVPCLAVPGQVKITLTLVDQKAVDKGFTGAELDFCRRQFTKVILLSR
jgi:type II secretory pathway component PulJ